MYFKAIKTLWIIFGVGLLGLMFWVGAVSGNWFGIFGGMPDLKELENPKNQLASELWSADGTLLGKYYRENRKPVSFDELSEPLINALYATEDIRFYDHSGIDMKGTFAILWHLVQFRKRGSSTITQQLAKNLFRTRGEESKGWIYEIFPLKVLTVKTKEWVLAVRLERSYTKREIAAMYLTTVDFGRNSFGIHVAAKRYFGTTPDKLDIAQSAILVGMLKAPTYYNPSIPRFYDNALRRRNTVLNQMVKYRKLDQTTADSIKQTEIVLNMQEENHNTGIATYFRTAVRNELMDWCKSQGYDLFGDGLRIYTTLDSRMQRHAEAAVTEHMTWIQKQFFKSWKGRAPWRDKYWKELKGFLASRAKRTDRYRSLKKEFNGDSTKIAEVMHTPIKMTVFDWNSPNHEKDTILSPVDSVKYYKHFMHMGLMALDPFTGQIKAWVGGINHKYFQFDNVIQARQPGSTFKPIIYLGAIVEHGFSPCDYVYDSPVTFVRDNGVVWKPKNSGGYYSYQQMTLRRGLAKSVNTVAAYLMKKIKPINAVKYAHRLGITTPLDTIPALCLGVSNVSIKDLSGVYATFVNKGKWNEPHFIHQIKDKNGKLIYEKHPKSRQPISEEHAYLMLHLLQGPTTLSGGTALGLWRYKFRKKIGKNAIGGKTGTTNNNSDGWFMGVTKNLIVGVRGGGEEPSIRFRSTYYGQGARMAMPAYGLFMDKMLADPELAKYFEEGDFPKPTAPLSVELNCSKYQRAQQLLDDSTMHILPMTPAPMLDW